MSIRDKFITVIFNQKTLMYLSVLALLDAIVQVTLGGVVRVTGSGLGCPDWPLCYGQIVPPFQLDTMIEYSHRLSGAVLGVLVLLLCFGNLVVNNKRRLIVNLSVISLILVVFAGLLGGITVLTELSMWVRLVHLGIAELLIAFLCAIVVFELPATKAIGFRNDKSIGQILIANLIITFTSILFVSYVVGSGYSSVCGTWPLCRGNYFPADLFSFMHMSHRYSIILILIGFGGLTFFSIRRLGLKNRFSGSLVLGVIILVVQIVLGAAMVWAGFANEIKAVHLTIATLFWVSLSIVASMYCKEYIRCT